MDKNEDGRITEEEVKEVKEAKEEKSDNVINIPKFESLKISTQTIIAITNINFAF